MSAKVQHQAHSSSSTTTYDSVVVGAGPYGLAAAAHLRKQGLNVKIFGRPFELWREHMPQGMLLRSHWWANTISAPKHRYTFEQFLQESTLYDKVYPTPIEAYIAYGLWFQQRAVPDVDETYVSSIERDEHGFILTLADERIIRSQTVVMAIGLQYYALRPSAYAHFAPELVSHSVDHKDLSRFAGKTVIVVGGGQSATEGAALLNEAGAKVHIVVRRRILWLGPDRSEGRTLWQQLKAPRARIAPGWKTLILERLPYLFSRFPQERKDRYMRSHHQASANDWLWDRINGKVAQHIGQQITQITRVDEGLTVTLSDGTQLQAAHVMYATGYAVDISRLPMLTPSLLQRIDTDEGTPHLNSWFECSVPGLYFIGFTSLRIFGPLYRFVFGNGPAAQRITRSIASKLRQANKHR